MRPRPWFARQTARALAVAVTALAVALPAAPASAEPCPGPASCTVDGDPEGAAYVGDGGLLLPADGFSGSDADRVTAATCVGCRWALVPMCKRGGLGNGSCGPAARSCPPGERRLEVFLRRPGDPAFTSIGLVCLAPGAPTTVSDLADRLRDLVVERVPALRPTFQPEGTTLVGLPTLFASGQPERLSTRRFDLVGFAVELDARATWAWQFGDGQELVTHAPGGRFPDRSVQHTYRRAGSYPVVVTAVWDGWFTVDGMGPFAVGGATVTQTALVPVAVREARAVLVSE